VIVPRPVFESICQRHGLDPAAAHSWVVKSTAVFVEIDEQAGNLPWRAVARPMATQPAARIAKPSPRCLAGTHLKQLLARFGISADEPGCQCKSRAAAMDAQGCEWVAANMDTVVGWLREEAAKRGLPFIDAAGRLLVREALRRARKDAERAARPPRQDPRPQVADPVHPPHG
jgi:hypothetical protein